MPLGKGQEYSFVKRNFIPKPLFMLRNKTMGIFFNKKHQFIQQLFFQIVTIRIK